MVDATKAAVGHAVDDAPGSFGSPHSGAFMASIATVSTSGAVESIDFPWLEATAEEAIDLVRDTRTEPCHGAALLSCGTEKLAAGTELGSCQTTSFTFADFSRLLPAKCAALHIPTPLRGITVKQLADVVGFIRDFAPLWYEAHRGSPQFGQVLAPEVPGLQV